MWANKGIVMADEGPVEPAPPVSAVVLAGGDLKDPWGPGYVQVDKPDEATHVYEPTIGVKALPCAYPRSLQLRWLKALAPS